MTSSFAISLSGLQAASTRLAVAGSNIANARSAGDADGEGLHRPMRVEQSAEPGGGTRATPVPVEPPTMPVLAPDDPRAGEDATVDYPNLSLAEQFVEMKLAKIAYQANLAALEVGDEMLGELLDTAS
jgi:flagellar basal body rod protein FlgC